MVYSVTDWIVQQVPVEHFNPRAGAHLYRFVNVWAFPTRLSFFVEPQLPIGIPTTPANPSTHVKRTTRNQIAIRELFDVLVPQVLNRTFELFRNAFIRIET